MVTTIKNAPKISVATNEWQIPGTESSNVKSIRPLLKELERAIHWTIARGMVNPTEDLVTTFNPRGRKTTLLGSFTPNVWNIDGVKTCEISISAEGLKRETMDVLATLIHELVHFSSHCHGIVDCSKTGPHHNKKFAVEAERMGLICTNEGGPGGWNVTSLGEDLRKAIENDFIPDESVFTLFRESIPVQEKKRTLLNKYSCSCEKPINIRCAVALDATCNICGEDFELQA